MSTTMKAGRGMSKTEEVEVLQRIAAGQEPGTYLASLLNPELVDWAKYRIEADLSPDILNHLLTAQEHQRQLRQALADKDRELAKLRAKIDELDCSLFTAQAAMQLQEQTIGQHEHRVRQLIVAALATAS